MTNMYHARELNYFDIPAYLDLQDQVRPQTIMANGHSTMLCRDRKVLSDHLMADMSIVGIFNSESDGTEGLVAATLLTYPDVIGARHIDNYGITDNLSQTFILHGFCVATDHQRKRLPAKLIEAAFLEAAQDSRFYAYLKSASEKESLRQTFGRHGFSKVAEYQDAVRGHQIQTMRMVNPSYDPHGSNSGRELSPPARIRYINV